MEQKVTHQRPMTARGMPVLSLSDEWGMINAVVTPAYRLVLRGEAPVWLAGTVTWRHSVPMVQVTRLAPLARILAGYEGNG